MVHLRLNDPDTSRNKEINYITALPQHADCEQARHRLQQVAAQVQPVMKKHGFQINSLEEFEWNREFAGRNWNNGETIELVLRRQDGSFAPLHWVLMVFCHELAHIKYMNHIPSQHGKLDRELRNECRNLQARGYYGDGFWSAGQRLEDNAFVAGNGMDSLQGLPEYSCGGAFQSKAKRQTRKRRRTTAASGSRKQVFRGPNLRTGAQTAPNTKGGRRVQTLLPGQSSRVDGHNHLPRASALNAVYKQDPNSTFRKRAQTASARELRAQAAMRRLNLLKTEDFQLQAADDRRDAFWPQDNDQKSSFASPSTSESGRDKVKDEEETASGSETEDDQDSKEGALVIRLDDNSSDESETTDLSNTPLVRLKTEKDPPEPSTFASRESEMERLDRSRLYRQHEIKQGGMICSTSDDWQDFCSIARMPVPCSSKSAPDNLKMTRLTPDNSKRNTQREPIEILSSDEEDVNPILMLQTTLSWPSPGPSAASQEWPCQVCTLLNPATAASCDACLTTRGSFNEG